MSRRAKRVSTPIVLTIVAVSLSIALLVGWTLVIAHTFMQGPPLAGGVWLLVLGIASFIFVVTVLVLFGISLVREILEGRRQVGFIDSVTHELKSPLASLRLCLQTMSRPDLSDSQRDDLQRMMDADVERLASFIDDVLNASRVTSGSFTASVSEVDVRRLVDESAEQVAKRHEVDRASIRIEGEEQPIISNDRSALRVVLDNLVDNAIKYSDSPVEIAIELGRLPDGHVLIEISDKGIGIGSRDLKRIFRRFYRVPDAEVRARRGTGLGLYVVSAMVKGMGGRIEAMSSGRSEGTTMRVTLPPSP